MEWNSPTPGNMMEVITQCLDLQGIGYCQFDDEGVCQVDYPGKHMGYQVYIFSDSEEHRLALFYTTIPLKIQPAQRSVVAEYLTRANYRLIIGNFEMNFEKGTVRYRASIDVWGGVITIEMVQILLRSGFENIDTYVGGLMGVLYRNLTPAQAIAELERHSAMQQRAAQAALNQ